MNRMTCLFLPAVAAAGLFSATAGASPLLQAVDPGVANGSTYVAHNNDLGLPGGSTQTVLVGYRLDATGPGSLLYTYLGKEAGYTNTMNFSLNAGGCKFATSNSAVGSTCRDTTSGGPLVFSFESSGTAATLVNGADFSFSTPMNFGLKRLDDYNWLVLLDDSGGSPNDKDFDDLGVKVTFRPASVPEPATLGLLGLGLAAMGFARRRQRA
jgi:hypothetical protein